MKKNKKVELVKMLTEELKLSKLNILVNFSGLSVSEMQNLREQVKKNGKLMVVKNSLIERTLKDLGQNELCEYLEGPVFVVWTIEKDEIGIIKKLIGFKKDIGKIELKAGFLGGEIISAEEIASIGELPGRKELETLVVSYIKMPVVRVINSLKYPAIKMLNVLNQIKEQKEKTETTDKNIKLN